MNEQMKQAMANAVFAERAAERRTMIEDRKLTRTVTLHCNNGEYKTVQQTAEVQLRWMSDCPEVDPNPLGFVNATPWALVATDPRQIEYELAAAFAAKHGCEFCGTQVIDNCAVCGAPQCCPKCCQETTAEILSSYTCNGSPKGCERGRFGHCEHCDSLAATEHGS